MRDSAYADGVEVWFRQWPDAPDGDIDDDGTVRPMTADEVAEWHARNPPPPLVDPAEWPPEDEQVAGVALLTEDSVTTRGMAALLAQKHNALVAALAAGRPVTAAHAITEAEVARVAADGLERLATLALFPDEVRRPMIRDRIARAEALRDRIDPGK